MKFIAKENFRFKSRYLWLSLILTTPWFVLCILEVIHPHYDWSGLFIPICSLLSLVLIVLSVVRKEREVLFLGVCCMIWTMVAPLPLYYLTMPDDMQTYSTMLETLERIQLYIQEHNRIPARLDLLPKEEMYPDPIVDAWGGQLHCEVELWGVVQLTSFGKDKQAGGEGDNRDIILRYRTRNPDGSFNVNDPYWFMSAKIKDTFRD